MKSDGLRLYSIHRFNFVRVRHGEHTYERSDDDFLSEALPEKRQGLDLAGSML
ncbi:hypothetical protein BH23ACT5_BH23ACT5_01860 [soil metagenome]